MRPLSQRRADRRCELRIFRDQEADVEDGIQIFKDFFCLRDGGKVAGQNDVVQSLVPCGEDAEHAGGLEYHVENGERDVAGCGDVRKLSEVGGGHVDRQG